MSSKLIYKQKCIRWHFWMIHRRSLQTILTRTKTLSLESSDYSGLWSHSYASIKASQLKTPRCISADWARHPVWAERKPVHTMGHKTTQWQSDQWLNCSQNRECFSIKTLQLPTEVKKKIPHLLGFIFCHRSLWKNASASLLFHQLTLKRWLRVLANSSFSTEVESSPGSYRLSIKMFQI